MQAQLPDRRTGFRGSRSVQRGNPHTLPQPDPAGDASNAQPIDRDATTFWPLFCAFACSTTTSHDSFADLPTKRRLFARVSGSALRPRISCIAGVRLNLSSPCAAGASIGSSDCIGRMFISSECCSASVGVICRPQLCPAASVGLSNCIGRMPIRNGCCNASVGVIRVSGLHPCTVKHKLASLYKLLRSHPQKRT